MFPSTSFAEWKEVSRDADGTTFYVDFERIRKHGEYVYFWWLVNFLKPSLLGDLSNKSYHQGDCKLFRIKTLSYSFHKEPMGGGTGETVTPKNPEWIYAAPTSMNEDILKKVCSR